MSCFSAVVSILTVCPATWVWTNEGAVDSLLVFGGTLCEPKLTFAMIASST
jgi:hypothetical protein